MLGRAFPKENRIIFAQPGGNVELRWLHVEVLDEDNTVLLGSDFWLDTANFRPLSLPVRLANGRYTVRGSVEVRTLHPNPKTTWGDWTQMGFQHQVELEGRDLTFPLPLGTP